jgi:hypothetical protein
MGTHLKLTFDRPSNNPEALHTVGLAVIKVWAQHLQFYEGIENREIRLTDYEQR